MSAATSDRATRQKPGEIRALGIAAAAILFAGCLACIDADGYAVDGADTSGYRFLGVVRKGEDNTDGSDGTLNTEVYAKGDFLLASSGLAAEDVGKAVYLIDNQTVGLSANASVDQHIFVGRITKVESATACWVAIDPDGVDPNLIDVTVDVAGAAAAGTLTSGLATIAAAIDSTASGLYVKAVTAMSAYVIATGLSAGRKVVTTNYTVSGGVITCVTDESLNRLHVSLRGVLKQS